MKKIRKMRNKEEEESFEELKKINSKKTSKKKDLIRKSFMNKEN